MGPVGEGKGDMTARFLRRWRRWTTQILHAVSVCKYDDGAVYVEKKWSRDYSLQGMQLLLQMTGGILRYAIYSTAQGAGFFAHFHCTSIGEPKPQDGAANAFPPLWEFGATFNFWWLKK